MLLVGHGTSGKLFNPQCSPFVQQEKLFVFLRALWRLRRNAGEALHDKDSVNTVCEMPWGMRLPGGRDDAQRVS